jgi:hypothetical protein
MIRRVLTVAVGSGLNELRLVKVAGTLCVPSA